MMTGWCIPFVGISINRSIRLLLRSFVETKTKFTVCGEAENGTDAIENAQQLQPDLVLLDLSMPLLNGTPVGQTPTVPILGDWRW
jgi:DNA-binding NarL/FixJ family response regulator